MKKAFFSLVIILLVPVFLFGCGPSKKEHEKLKAEVEKLRLETEALLVEKEELQTAEPELEIEKALLEKENKSLQTEKVDLESHVDKLSGEIDSAIEQRKAEIDRKKQKAAATKRVEEKRRAKSKTKEAKPKKKTKAAKKNITKKKVVQSAELEKKIVVAHATRHMKTRADKQEGIKWYHDKNSPLYMDNNSFQLYFGMKNGSKPLLRIRVQHQGPEWLFIKSFTVAADWSKFVKDPAHFNRDKGSTRTWEWYDASLTDKDIDMIIAVISSVKAKVIMKGAQDKDEHVITSAEKESLRNVLDAYLEVGGEL